MGWRDYTPLMYASISGHLEVVELLIGNSQIEVNTRSGMEQTALWFASSNGNTEVVKLLLTHNKIDVNPEDINGVSALHISSQYGYTEVVRLLIDHPNIDINKLVWTHDIQLFKLTGKVSALWIASGYGNLDIVKLLLDHPQIVVDKGKFMDVQGQLQVGQLLYYHDITELNTNQELIVAAVIGNLTKINMLLENEDLDINSADGGGRTTLHWASKNGYSDIVKILLGIPQIDVNKGRTSDAGTALMLASLNGHSEVVTQLLNFTELEINQVDSHGRSSLFKASQNGHSNVTKLLLGYLKIDINLAEPQEGQTPLFVASKYGYFDIVTYLLGHPNINVNKATINRETPLMAASMGGDSRIVVSLLRYPTINVNFAAFGGKTAIFYTFYESHETENRQREILELILRCPSIDMTLMDEKGNSALGLARKLKRNDIEEAFNSQFTLRQKGHTCCSNEVNDGLQISAGEGDITMVKAFLLCHQVDLNQGYKYGQTPLYMAAMNNHGEVVEALLSDYRTDVNAAVNNDNALFVSSEKGYLKIVRLLLAHPDIDVNKINTRSRKTALIIASEQGHLEIVRTLLHNPQTFVNEIDLYGKSALKMASLRGFLRVVKILLRCPKTDVSMQEAGYHGYDIEQAMNLHSSILAEIDATCCQNVKGSLIDAAWIGDFRAIRGLIQCPDADVNAADDKGRTPLYIASWMGHIKAVEVLLKTPKINDAIGTKAEGCTPFSIASEKVHFKIMEQLIMHGHENVNTGWCQDNWTPGLLICNSSNMSNAPSIPKQRPG